MLRTLILAILLWPATAAAQLLPPQPAQSWDLPEPMRNLAAWGFALQRQMNADIRRHLAELSGSASWEPAAALIVAAFVYGVLHAVGPGHGKLVIGGWFATRRVRLRDAVAACGLSALVQAGSAVAIVGIPAGLLALAPRDVMTAGAWIETFSYGLICVLGLVMGWRTLKGHTCSHGHHHHDGDCCGHDHQPLTIDTRPAGLFSMAAAVGFRPCSGAILVLLFTLANNMFLIGIAATLAMGVGVALTVSGIGIGALGINRLLERAFGGNRHGDLLRKVLGLAGAAAITVLGAALLAGALIQGPRLTG